MKDQAEPNCLAAICPVGSPFNSVCSRRPCTGSCLRGAGMRTQTAPPQKFGLAAVLRAPPRQHEKRIAQAIEIAQWPWADVLLAAEPQDNALGAAAHGAALME